MARVLVDANKYLEFYQSTPIGRLVPLLLAIGDDLLVTQQIADEVARNRTSCAQQFLAQSWQKKTLRYSFPAHLVSCNAADLADVTARVEEANNKSTSVQRALDKLMVSTVLDIAYGRDPVSTQLAQVMSAALTPSAEELTRARLRKELGNPPGKRSDPLGDQVTWEQFLSRVKGVPILWIITGDGDYCYDVSDKSLVLNPILQEDVVRAAGPKTKVRCFKTLAEGLKDATDELKRKPARALTAEEIAAIRETELENAARSKTPAVLCPRCGGATSWHALQAVQGYGGGLVFFTCPYCGAQFDTE